MMINNLMMIKKNDDNDDQCRVDENKHCDIPV